MSDLAWKTYVTADGSMPFAVFVEGHQDIVLASDETRKRLQLGVMSLGYGKIQAREWVDGAEIGQFWLAPNGNAGEDGQPLWEFCAAEQAGAVAITGAKFL